MDFVVVSGCVLPTDLCGAKTGVCVDGGLLGVRQLGNVARVHLVLDGSNQ